MGALNAAYSDETPVVVREGDTPGPQQWTLLNQREEPVDLTGRSVNIRLAGSDLSTAVLDAPATVEDATAGVVSYAFDGSALAPGRYRGEFVVDPHPDLVGGQTAAQHTVPATGCIPVEIDADDLVPSGYGVNYGVDYQQ